MPTDIHCEEPSECEYIAKYKELTYGLVAEWSKALRLGQFDQNP